MIKVCNQDIVYVCLIQYVYLQDIFVITSISYIAMYLLPNELPESRFISEQIILK